MLGRRVRLILPAIRYTQYDIRIHYQAQLSEKCNPNGASIHLIPLGRLKELVKTSRHVINVMCLAFPDNADVPTCISKLLYICLISFYVILSFSKPVLSICLGDGLTVLTVMTMPEAAMNKDHLTVSLENHIRFAWKVAAVKPIPESHLVDQTSYD